MSRESRRCSGEVCCHTTSETVTNITIKAVSQTTPPTTPTEGLERFHQLDGELLPFWQLLQHLGHLIVSTPNQAMAVDRLDHITHVDDLDLVDDASLADSLKTAKLQ